MTENEVHRALSGSYERLQEQLQDLASVLQLHEQQQKAAHDRFFRLMRRWKTETEHLSNITRKCMHPAYQEIIGMGDRAMQFILKDLAETRSDWFWALSAISGENPITEEIAGNVQAMTEAWLQWAKVKGYDDYMQTAKLSSPGSTLQTTR